MKFRNKLGVVIVCIVLCLTILGIVSFIIYNLPTQRVKRQLSLGQKYLKELDYENAIQAYRKALTIDPMSEEAYVGMANVYMEQNDYENALSTIAEGIEIIGENERLEAFRKEIEKKLEEQKQEEERKRREQIEAARKAAAPEVSDWTFDLYDILRYDLFGKDVSEWTREEFKDYLETNGYSTNPEPGKAQYAVIADGFDQAPFSAFMGGDIHVQIGGDHAWSVGRQTFSPQIAETGMVLRYEFPGLYQITESEFLERLPSDVVDRLNSSGERADDKVYYSDGFCNKEERTHALWCVNFEEEVIPEEDVTAYRFRAGTKDYVFLFSASTHELVEICEM